MRTIRLLSLVFFWSIWPTVLYSQSGLDDEHWDSSFADPRIYRDVYALAATDVGNLYVGGFFGAGTSPDEFHHIARWDGRGWSKLGAGQINGVNYTLNALVASGSDLYAGGEFGAIYTGPVGPGFVVNGIAKWDGQRWSRLGNGTAFGVAGSVYALAVDGTNFFVGGNFIAAGGTSLTNVAKWNGQQWSALGPGLGDFQNDRVTALAVAPDGTLYAGGNFLTSGGRPVQRLAKWDGTQWTELGGGADDWVNAIAVFNGEVFVGGQFTRVGEKPIARLARWDGAEWSAVGGGVRGGDVFALTASGDGLYVGGSLADAGIVPANGIAKWDGFGWSALGEGLSGGDPTTVLAITVKDGFVYAGGKFDRAGDVSAPHVARWDGQQWSAMNNALTGPGGVGVNAVATQGTNLFVSGDFTTAGGIPANHIACWDGGQWSPLGSGLDQRALALSIHPDGSLYAGGQFSQAGGASARGIARWDGLAWATLGDGVEGGGRVSAIAFGTNGDVYAGGRFSQIGSVAAANIARWDGTRWWPMGGGVTRGQFSALVSAITVLGSEVYVGGSFDQAGGVPAAGIAKWTGGEWMAVGGGVDYPGSTPSVAALAFVDGELFAGGNFKVAGGTPANFVARWDGQNWFPLGSGLDSGVDALALLDGKLYSAGNFSRAGGRLASGVARWDGAAWASLGHGLGGSAPYAFTLGASSTNLFVGGSFTAAGQRPATALARWFIDDAPPEVRLTKPNDGATFQSGADLELEAEASDPDGAIQRIEFSANGELLGQATQAPFTLLWSNVPADDYLLTVQATDNLGATAVSTPVRVSVLTPATNVLPAVALVQPRAGERFVAGANLALEAQADDSDGRVVSVDFLANDSLIGTATSEPFVATWANLPVGDYALTARATDDQGGRTISEPVAISVAPLNLPPVITFDEPAPESLHLVPGAIPLRATATDREGQVIQVEFSANGALLGTVRMGNPFALDWTTATPGVFALTATATDDEGLQASAEIVISVYDASGPPPAQVTPSRKPRSEFWAPDGPVYAIVEADGIVYLGGVFDNVGQVIPGCAVVDLSSTPPDLAYPMADGQVWAMATDGEGGLFIGGWFKSVDGEARSNLAHIRADKTLDLDWPGWTDGRVKAMTFHQGVLYLGGVFATVNDEPRQNAAALDVASGALLPWNPMPSDSVEALVRYEDTVFLGGTFWEVGGQPHRGIAAVDAGSGQLLDWPYPADDDVLALTASAGRLFIGGDFGTIGSKPRQRLAAFDLATGALTDWNPGADRIVRSLSFADGLVYVAGHFGELGGAPMAHVGALNALTGGLSSWKAGVNGAFVEHLAVSAAAVFISGVFTEAGGAPRRHLAGISRGFDLRLMSVADLSGMPDSGNRLVVVVRNLTDDTLHFKVFDREGQAVVDNSEADFPDKSSEIAALKNLLAPLWEQETLSDEQQAAILDAVASITDQPPSRLTGEANELELNPFSPPSALANVGGRVFAAGRLQRVYPTPRKNLAALDTATGRLTSWNPEGAGEIWALAIKDKTLYVGGLFGRLGGVERSSLGAVDTTTGAVTDWNPRIGAVMTLAIAGNTLYVGGQFLQAVGQPRKNLAAYDLTTGQLTGWDPRANDLVQVVAPAGDRVFIGGNFTELGNVPRNHLGCVDAATGQVLPWNPAADGAVVALAVDAENHLVYVGGAFHQVGGRQRDNLAALDFDSSLATPWAAFANGSVLALEAANKVLFIGGQFERINDAERLNLAALNPRLPTPNLEDWKPDVTSRSSGSEVRTILVTSSALYVGGRFLQVGKENRSYFAAFDMPTRFAFPQMQAGGPFQANVLGPQGREYIFQTSTNLVDWSSLATNQIPNAFEDPTTPGTPYRFYRAISPR